MLFRSHKEKGFRIEFNWLNIIAYSLLFIFTYLMVRRQLELRFLVEWGDESETIIATKMMAAGYRLYTEVYNNHGPLTFLPGLIISSFGNFRIETYRWIPIVLQWFALISIYFSPLYKDKLQRIFATLISGWAMIVFMPLIYGHTYLYQTMSGIFMIIILAQYTLPVLLKKEIYPIQILIGNFLTFSLLFLAVTNLPFALIIFVITFRQKYFKFITIGGLLALGLNLGFLLMYGSWDGYIAYHYYLNANVLYSGQGIFAFIKTILDFYAKNLDRKSVV